MLGEFEGIRMEGIFMVRGGVEEREREREREREKLRMTAEQNSL